MEAEQPSAQEIFNAALELFEQGEVEDAVACLRAGFFENLYMAPVLLEEDYDPQPIWHPGPGAEPPAALEYRSRYGRLWGEKQGALGFLREVWHDPLVRGELRSFINLSKAIRLDRGAEPRADLLRERERFGDLRRIRGTQSDIVARLRASVRRRSPERPRLGLVLLAARDAVASVDFYRKLFEVEPVQTSRLAGGYAEFELPGVRLGIHGQDRLADGDPYGLGSPPASFGWGAILVITVADLDRYRRNAVEAGVELIDLDQDAAGRRFFVVKDPSGYLVEVTEEREPRGFSSRFGVT